MKQVILLLTIGLGTWPIARGQSATLASRSGAQYVVGSDRHSLIVARDGDVAKGRTCRIDEVIDVARVSFDGAAVIVSANAYVLTKDLVLCDGAPARIAKTPQRAGMVVDVNVRHRLYVALSPVSTQPMSFIATVAKLGSERNLVALPGAYIAGQSAARQSKQAFSYDDANGPYAKISWNGRYVSVDGVIDCSPDSYPGVWDIVARKRVVIVDDAVSRDDRCNALFSAPTVR